MIFTDTHLFLSVCFVLRVKMGQCVIRHKNGNGFQADGTNAFVSHVDDLEGRKGVNFGQAQDGRR